MSDYGSYFDLETIREYILSRGGKITNHDLVKHFRSALTNPVNKDVARIQFKEIVNEIATITRNDEGEKHLVLKNKYMVTESPEFSASLVRYDDEEPPSYKPPPPPDDMSEYSDSQSTSSDWTNRMPRSHGGSVPSTPQSTHQASKKTGSATSSPALSRPASSLRSSTSRDSISTHLSLRSSKSRESVAAATPSSHRSSASRDSASTPPTSHRSSTASSTSTPSTSQRSSSSTPPTSHRSSASSISSPPRDSVPTPPLSPEPPPPVPPRRKSSDKLNNNYKDITAESKEAKENKRPKSFAGESDKDVTDESKISVRERLQKFNRLASESQLTETPFRPKKRFDKATDKDEDDSASVSSLQLDPKFREWLVKCSQGDYQPVAKMAAENPRLVKLKNTANGYTALHWAAKYGNQDLVKLIAGTYGANVNARTNGGYTALHIAMQYGHEDLYNLLVKVYGADASIRDWSGKKARQYLLNKDTSLSADTFRKLKARKKQSEHGFLRIGSLNVRVKKTTEAFSNFLGVGHGDKLHKNWGSADDLPQDDDCKKMPPPKQGAVIKKRKSKRPFDFGQTGVSMGSYTKTLDKCDDNAQDSDSDTAAGFGSQWQSTV